MTTYGHRLIKCGNCGRRRLQKVLTSTSSFGSPDLDLRPPALERLTMDCWLQLCPKCGYCAPDLSVAPEDAAVYQSKRYRDALARQDLPGLARRFFAYAHALDPANPAAVGWAFLQAAWVCDDDGLAAEATACRELSADWFLRCTPFTGDEENLTTGAVLVDVLRRAGRFAEASSECEALLALRDVEDELRQVLQFQSRLIAKGDRDRYTMSVAWYAEPEG
jgi:hypothetical protein